MTGYIATRHHDISSYRVATWISVQGMVLLSYECNRKNGVWMAWRNKPCPKQRMCTVGTFLFIKAPIRTAGGFCMLWLTSSICVFCSTMWSIYFFTYASCCIMSFISQIEFWSLTYIYKKVHKVYVGFLNGWCRGFLCIFPLGDRLECVSDRVKDGVLASS